MDEGRSTLDILWSCLATLIVCVWVAFHPRIPSSANPSGVLDRLLYDKPYGSITALLAPEMMVGVAFYDWMRVKLSRRKIIRWALKHTTIWTQRNYPLMVSLLFTPAATNSQCHFVGEWTTAHSMVHQMHGFKLIANGEEVGFSDDPLREIFFLARQRHIQLREIRNDIRDRSKSDRLSKIVACVQAGWFFTQCIARRAERLQITELELTAMAYVVLTLVTYVFWWNKPLDVSLRIPIIISDKAFQELESFRDRGLRARDDLDDLDSTANFDSTRFSVERAQDVVATVSGCIFGAIHCTAWTNFFPTEEERMLWRVCSAAVTALPPLILITGIYNAEKGYGYLDRLQMLNEFLYVVARLALITEAFVSLRSNPASVHQVVKWTTFVPHI